jgi:hypothetical protein
VWYETKKERKEGGEELGQAGQIERVGKEYGRKGRK